jgi:nucleoside-diphosphate-sugar epimerase
MVPLYIEAVLEHKEVFYLGDGDNMRAVTHLDDVVDFFILVLDGALQGGGEVKWGKEVCMTIDLYLFPLILI